jgi:hypothetical protein
MNILATFSGAKFHDTTQRIVEDAPKLGADKVLVFDDHWLRTRHPGFVARLAPFFTRPDTRGFGFFCWKPLVILDALRRCSYGDVVLYVDADTVPIADLTPLYDTCRRDGGKMLFSAVGCVEYVWTKRDAFIVLVCDEWDYWYSPHAVARFMLFQKGGEFPAEHFLWDWLAYASSPLVNTFDRSIFAAELPGHREPRCEQSVLSLLAKRYGCRLYREACQFGNSVDVDKELYGQVFEQRSGHTYVPGYAGDESAGSVFRNVDQ